MNKKMSHILKRTYGAELRAITMGIVEQGRRKVEALENLGAVKNPENNNEAMEQQFRALQESMLSQFKLQQDQWQKQQEQMKIQQEQMQKSIQEQMRQMLQFQHPYGNNKEGEEGDGKLTIVTTHASSDKKNAVLSQFRRKILKLSDSIEEDISGVSKYALENMKVSWEKQFDDIKRLHLELTTEHGMEEVDDELEDIERKMNTKINNIILKIGGLKEESQAVELKRIQIPCFNRNMEEWSSFHDLFKKLVDRNAQLSEVQKLYYLKTNLRGEAFRLVQHLQVTEANYRAAWELLEKRYDNKRILFTKLIDKILDHPNINSLSAASIRNLVDSVNESIHALRAMGIPLEHADPIIARIIIRKLDKDGLIQYEHNVKKSKEIQKLEDVMDFLEQQYQALEASTSKKYAVSATY
ncbi:uncharacterized protein LOC131804242 isoform X3 [Musca domestica]|uniref:Uncharacterized protein LOC131804242 isoform X3 n=1 Tax=Musca domestica TaxID=7370 RepID=A0ABM3VAI8_MUSDO|nr:uncharacterized protein LOC131804242 isoform X3 [Musca domestica]